MSNYQIPRAKKIQNRFKNGREFRFFPEEPCSFADFLGGTESTVSQDGEAFSRVVNFFRDIITKVEIQERMEHFALVVTQDREKGFVVTVIEVHRKPPRKVLNCLSCDTESETNKVSRLEYSFTKSVTTTITSTTRNMFIVTPVRHVERLSECTDEEIFEMFHFAVQLIGEEMKLSNPPWEGVQFEKMTLNHGNARNLEHLHLKVRIVKSQFDWFKKHGWDEDKKERFRQFNCNDTQDL
ncbi:4076_t:CDS:2 [Ambispora gerdemannii]|uniref:4076_t:CDS:1 n=1 Tax=Ambispora gerdemannii TaxID=144530 RepID=A0A9N8WLY2_9GLOM|nr:4076_t:CDS:2 [Ambispora gerdemannii]